MNRILVTDSGDNKFEDAQYFVKISNMLYGIYFGNFKLPSVIIYKYDFFFIFFSYLSSIQNEAAAMAAVALYTLGRACGSPWGPTFLHLFPVSCFGFLFGIDKR